MKTEREVVEGWRPGWNEPTAVVWLAVDPKQREPIVAFAEYTARSPNAEDHGKRVRRVRHHFEISEERVTSYGPPKPNKKGLRDWGVEYARLGFAVAPCLITLPEIRGQRIARDLARRMRVEDVEDLQPALLLDRRCGRLIHALRAARFREDGTRDGQLNDLEDEALIDALGFALVNCPEPWPKVMSEIDVEEQRKEIGAQVPARPMGADPEYFRKQAARAAERAAGELYGDPDWV